MNVEWGVKYPRDTYAWDKVYPMTREEAFAEVDRLASYAVVVTRRIEYTEWTEVYQ